MYLYFSGKNEFAPPGLEPWSSDFRSAALPLSYRLRQVFTSYVRFCSECVATVLILTNQYQIPSLIV